MTDQNTQVATWRDQAKVSAATLAAKEAVSWPTISHRGGKLKIDGKPVKDNLLPCVILASTSLHKLYTTKFRDGDNAPPVCFAVGDFEEALRPHANCAEPKATHCAACHWNDWETKGEIFPDQADSRAKACANTRRLAVIPINNPSLLENVEALRELPIYALEVPTTSVKNWKLFVKSLRDPLDNTALPPFAFLSAISAEGRDNGGEQVVFRRGQLVPDAAGEVLVKMAAAAQQDILYGYAPQAPKVASEEPSTSATKTKTPGKKAM